MWAVLVAFLKNPAGWLRLAGRIMDAFEKIGGWLHDQEVRRNEQDRIELEARRERERATSEADQLRAEIDDLGSNDLDERYRRWLQDEHGKGTGSADR